VSRTSTIVAIATAPAPGGIGIVRISGPDALAVARPLLRPCPEVPAPRVAHFAGFLDRAGQVLDEGVWIHFPAPRSFTAEDVVELHAHGGPRLLRLLEQALLADDRVRLAEPGEFTKRAFLNGRIDLACAEAIADLIAAGSESAVRAAAAQLRGALSERVSALRAELLELYADLEGVLSFPDEAEGAERDAAERLARLVHEADSLAETGRRGALVRRGARVAIFGPVNAGKSSLFNALVGESRAIVDPEPGTTRDVLEASLELKGSAVTLLDTAGLRDDAGRLESIGIARAKDAVAGADLAVLVVPPEASDAEVDAWRGAASGVACAVVRGKADLPGRAAELAVSAVTGQGVEALRERIHSELFGTGAASAVQLTSERHLEAIRRAAACLRDAHSALAASTLEVVAGEVGSAVEALGEITGESASRDVIDAIFRRFCIGK
jgi:tRNA modification GTPase